MEEISRTVDPALRGIAKDRPVTYKNGVRYRAEINDPAIVISAHRYSRFIDNGVMIYR